MIRVESEWDVCESNVVKLQADLRKITKQHRLARHPFFLTLQTSRHLPLFKAWAHEQYVMSISLAPCFAALIARCPAKAWRQRAGIIELTVEEGWGTNNDIHGGAFRRFFVSLGGNLAELDHEKFLEATLEAAEGRLAIARGDYGHDLASSILALAWANEFANLKIFGLLKRALKGIDCEGLDISYINLHLKDEPHHLEILLDMAAPFINSKTFSSSIDATGQLLEFRAKFFDAIYEKTLGHL